MRIVKSENSVHFRKAATAVEFSVVAIVFMTMLMGIFEFGRYFMVLQITKNAAREVARLASVKTDGSITTASLKQKAIDFMGPIVTNALSNGNPTISVEQVNLNGKKTDNWTNADYGEIIEVTISGNYKPIFNLFFKQIFKMEVSISIPSEGN